MYMKKSLGLRLFAIFLCSVILVSYGVMFRENEMVYGDTASELESANAEKADINKQLQNTKDELAALKKNTDDTEAYIAKLDEKMADLDGQLYELSNKIDDLTKQIEQKEVDLAEAEADADHQYEMMKLRIKFMYEHNDESYVALILSASSIGDMLNRSEYVSKISLYDRDMLTEYENTITYVAEVKAQLEEDRTSLESDKKILAANKASLEVMQKEKETELANYNKQIAQLNQTEQDLHSDLERLEDVIVAMEEKQKREEEEARKKAEEESRRKEEEAKKNDSTSSSGSTSGGSSGNNSVTVLPSTGKYLWPTISKRITSRYGATKNRPYPHQGVDIGAVKPGVWGDPIYAADGGKVTLASYDSGAGNWIWIYHGDGVYTVYMHCSKFYVSVGDIVERGDTIALMGSTGNSTGAHLHFAVRVNGEYVNPEPYIGIK